MCGDFNARTGNLYDLVEDNIFNDFGCDGIKGGLSTATKSQYERNYNDTLCTYMGHY